jgi:hypothetical protein
MNVSTVLSHRKNNTEVTKKPAYTPAFTPLRILITRRLNMGRADNIE